MNPTFKLKSKTLDFSFISGFEGLSSDQGSKLNQFEIIGIVVGACVVLIIGAVSLFVISQRYRQKRYVIRETNSMKLCLYDVIVTFF